MNKPIRKLPCLATLIASCATIVPGHALGQADGSENTTSRLHLEFETGAVAYARNDVRIPNDGGTRFDLRDLTGSGPEVFGRLALTWRLDDRHALRFTIAPLRITGSGVLDSDVTFEDSAFPAGAPTQGVYQFSNYRVTYRRMFAPGEHWHWGIGGALFVRDAEISLRQGGLRETNDDIGLVPLLHVYGERRIGDRTALIVDIEGAGASQGRAVDASIRVQRTLPNGMTLSAGYRGLEGGADNNELYTFAWLNYASFAVGWRF
jgi:hypothetical protein